MAHPSAAWVLLAVGQQQAGGAGGGDANVNLTGVAATGAVGTLSKTAQKTLSGVSATGDAGTFAKTVQKALSGVAGAGAAGDFAKTAQKALSGVAGAGAAGDFAKTAQKALSGVAGAGAAGDFAKTAQKALSGVGAAGAAGTLGRTVTKSLGGVAGAGAAGTITTGGDGTVNLTGVSASGAVGALARSINKSITGVQAAGAAGDIAKLIARNLTGVAATGAVSTFDFTKFANLTGVAGTGEVANFSFIISPTVELLGVDAFAIAGEFQFPEPVEPVLPGVVAVGAVGRLTAKVLGWSFDPGDAGDVWRPHEGDEENAWSRSPEDPVDVWFSNSVRRNMSGVAARGEIGDFDIINESNASRVLPKVTALGQAGTITPVVIGEQTPQNATAALLGTTALGRAGTIGIDILSGGGPSPDALKWHPDDVCPMVNPVTVHVANLPVNSSGQRVVSVPANTHVNIVLPSTTAIPNQIRVDGPLSGSNNNRVRIIGGQISRPDATSPGACIDIFNVAIAYVEGLRLSKNRQPGSGIVFRDNAGRGKLYIQNCRIDGIGYRHGGRCGETITQHGDWLICQTQVGGVFVDKLTGEVQTTGLLLAPEEFDNDFRPGPGIDEVHLSRVNTRIFNSDLALYGKCEAGHCAYFFASACGILKYKLTLENVWAWDDAVNGDSAGPRRTLLGLISPSSGISSSLSTCGFQLTGDPYTGVARPHSVWNGFWTGEVKGGIPPGGDYVPASFTGFNYVSPGYVGDEPIPLPTQKLTWNPATVCPLNNPVVVDIPVGGLESTFATTVDVLLRAPNAKITGKVQIQGGRNIRLIGGSFEMVNNGQNASGGAIDSRWERQLAFYGFTGVVYAEGLLMDRRGSIGDGLAFASASDGVGDVYIQNCRIVNIQGIPGTGNLRGDCVKTQGPHRHIRIDRLTFSSGYQGLFLPTRPDWTGPSSTITVKNTNGYALLGSSVGSVTLYWLRDSCTAGSAVELTTPITLEECWADPTQKGQAFRDTVFPKAHFNGSCGAVEVAGSPNFMDWPDSSNIFGTVKRGVPGGGDFVPASAVGLNYVSPGYL
jgi:hypothetical protein